MKFVKYDQFVQIVNEQGKYVCYDYTEDDKKSIINDFRPVLEGEPKDEPLKVFVDDIIETAKLLEVRVFPKQEYMLVRVEVMLRTDEGNYVGPSQLLALWDCFYQLKAYTFIHGESQTAEVDSQTESKSK